MFLDDLKIRRVTPVFKTGDAEDLSDNTPTSSLFF